VVCIPQRGGQKIAERQAYEKSPEFKQGQRFRVGIEGRISVLFRDRGMKRCLAEGRERFELCVGAAVLANNRGDSVRAVPQSQTCTRERTQACRQPSQIGSPGAQ
jgi:hypothetical protein